MFSNVHRLPWESICCSLCLDVGDEHLERSSDPLISVVSLTSWSIERDACLPRCSGDKTLIKYSLLIHHNLPPRYRRPVLEAALMRLKHGHGLCRCHHPSPPMLEPLRLKRAAAFPPCVCPLFQFLTAGISFSIFLKTLVSADQNMEVGR